ncbi:4-hydroxyphenylacetate 3-monooxygenase activator [Fulvivirga imtechensis AK7]|uniref:4-hydroxyphenylacetate 3-monooxygenase activator n=1 Tax=Fulvivirga imtechensis AK7 TaxID=1237149 RepID=L8JQF3_9BACT|nr:AraC family transcriptional regulator [Fulvivirga imtechensis]ELR71085.1 4-hydroxyphenylacetate 3-monooxygenase activator [Fulvivirga imtechensis AK7]
MVQIFPLEGYQALEKPRRVIKYVLVWCASGDITLTVDEGDFELKENSLITITSGQIHYLKSKNNARGYVLEFTLDFFCKDDTDIELIFHNGLFCHFSMNEVIPLDSDFIAGQLKLIKEELNRQPYQYLISVHSRIELILVEINRTKVGRGGEVWKPEALFLRFLELVRANYEKNYTVSQLALMLRTTEARLNEQAKLHAGKTAQNVIYGLTVSEAKRLLTYENLTVKEVAYKLGFSDPFYFSNFFKKHTGKSPKAYQGEYAL